MTEAYAKDLRQRPTPKTYAKDTVKMILDGTR
jgi:hypothetical protein